MTILSILLLFVGATQAAVCSTLTTAGLCSADVNCTWNPGRCSEFTAQDCATVGCPLGCRYTPAVRGSCVNTVECGTNDCSDGGASGTCQMSTGTCVTSDPVPECPAKVYGQGSCSYIAGCVDDQYTTSCVVQDNSGVGINCGDYSVAPMTDCTYSHDCVWSTESNTCVSPHDSASSNCGSYTNEQVSRCSLDQYCKVESGSCVYDSSVSIAELNSHCGSAENCSNPGTYCPPAEPCPEGEKCPSPGCMGDFVCKVSGDKCVFAADEYCGLSSTLPMTPCEDYYSRYCKISGGKCVNLTADELCFNYSVVRMSECDFANINQSIGDRCRPSSGGDKCLSNTNNDWDPSYCGKFSTIALTSACERSSGNKCEINSNGVCVSRNLVCLLNQAGTGCNNPSTDACSFRWEGSCKNVACGNYSNRYICQDVGCTWNEEITNCIPPACQVNSDGSCSYAGGSCESITARDASCVVDNTINCNKQTTSECKAILGCKWDYTLGGTCSEKTCASDASYARCCTSADCAYCSGLSKPSDCLQDPLCESNPSYSSCCPGVGCTGFCAEHPEDSGCKSGASHIIAPVISLLLLLILL